MTWGDIQITNVNHPPSLLYGQQTEILVDVQFFKNLQNWYCRILDADLVGSEPFIPNRQIGNWGVGAFASAAIVNKKNHFMPDRPYWNLRVEIGVMNFLGGFAYPTDIQYITIYQGSVPPETCPEGYYYDPVKGACVQYKRKPITLDKILLISSAGILLIGWIYPKLEIKRKRK